MNSMVFRNAVISLIVLAAAAAMSTIARSGTSPSGNTASVASRLRVYGVGVSDINDRGQVVGSLQRDYDGSGRGFVWRKGAWRLLGRGEWAGATRINERGQILGVSGDHDGHGVLWENGKPTNLGLTSVWSLNEAGQVLGGNLVGTPTDGYSPAPALWTNGGVRSLPFTPGHSTAMNNLGQVVGIMPDGRAAEWQDGQLTDLGAGEPIALNDHGEIIGTRGQDAIVWRGGTPTDIGPGLPVALNAHGEVIVSGPAHALLWRNGTRTDLGTLGGEWSTPTAISDRGQVVGYSTDRDGRPHGFVWQDGTMTRLPSPPGYAGAPTRALAINDRNQVIGDNYVPPDGDRFGPGSRFAVIWTLRGRRIETRLIWSEHRSGKQAGTPRTLAGRHFARNGRWIAYSTAPASDAFPGYAQWGSDVFVASVGGGRPRLVAGRGKAKVWNVCPAFSPNGRMLAFARVMNTVVWSGRDRSTIVVARLGRRGPIRAERLVLKVRGDRARCPVWSSDGSHLAYLEYGRVVVRDLHGSRRHRSGGDPTIRDFDRRVDELVSPSGDLVARRGPDGTIVSRLDGSDQRVIKDGWTAGWSPDGRQLLFWEDEYGAWSRLRAVSVDPPFASQTVVDHGPINGARSPLPGYGDVSWQPIPRPLGSNTSAGRAVVPDCQPPLLGPVRYSFWLNVCGPGRVIRNTQHTYEVAVKNFGRKNFRTVKLSVIHWEPISRSSVPYRSEYVRFGTARELSAIWTLHNFRPGRSFRVMITLPFKQHNDPKGSNLFVFVRGLHPSVGRPEVQEATKDITFVG